MSKIVLREIKCAVCGSVHQYRVLASTNAFGSPDLDLRPPEMQRSTMNVWIQECPDCGYISEDVSDPSDVTLDDLKSEDFLSCDGIIFVSDLASRFYKYYKINILDDNRKDAFMAILHAAWACDDADDQVNAKICREKAIPLISHLITENHKEKDNLMLIKADLLRRSSHFNALLNEFQNVEFQEQIMNHVMAFQLALAKAMDTACYKVSDAENHSP